MNEPLSKDLLYGDFRDGMAKREKLALKAAYKALDLAPDDMNINASRTTNGIGVLGAAGIALAAGIPALLVAWIMSRPAPETKTETKQDAPKQAAPTNTSNTSGFLIDLIPPDKFKK